MFYFTQIVFFCVLLTLTGFSNILSCQLLRKSEENSKQQRLLSLTVLDISDQQSHIYKVTEMATATSVRRGLSRTLLNSKKVLPHSVALAPSVSVRNAHFTFVPSIPDPAMGKIESSTELLIND